MNDEGNAWEEDIVRVFYHEELADTILKVPISRHGGDDFVSWMHDKHGQYTIRSAYNMARSAPFFAEQGRVGKGSASNLDAEMHLWKKIWAIQAPSKMKVVLWRIVHDCLPMGHQLVYRRIPANDSCMFCGQLSVQSICF
jgi:hypothetical protein